MARDADDCGLPLYRHLNVHGWLNFGGARMSKSSGNMPDPVEYEQNFGPDVLRYFVMREIVYGLDVDFSDERLSIATTPTSRTISATWPAGCSGWRNDTSAAR